MSRQPKQTRLTNEKVPSNLREQYSAIEVKIKGLGYSLKKTGENYTARKLNDDDAAPIVAKSPHWIYGEILKKQQDASDASLKSKPAKVKQIRKPKEPSVDPEAAPYTVDENVATGDRYLPTMEQVVEPELFEIGRQHAQIKDARMLLNQKENKLKIDLLELIHKKPELLDKYFEANEKGELVYSAAGLDVIYTKETTEDVKTRYKAPDNAEDKDGLEELKQKAKSAGSGKK